MPATPFAKAISLVTLGVADVPRSTAFYEALGFVRSPQSVDTTTFFQLSGVVLSLYGRVPLAEDAKVPAEGSGFRAVTLAQNFPTVEAVDAAYAHALSIGATPVKPPEAVFWGGYSGYFADPDGHLWEIAHNPFFPLDAEGRLHID
ncbi:VOC family protein [Chthonobacter albigriseus]|uniref:VOC family protein n=1 Tax=Chthonobacter albigriseus TaxID=1683161 RepID=UPI0015EE4FAB|nr:VOC family protein [Chthonobacter albigriseus]